MGRIVACVMGDLNLVRCLGRHGIPVALVTSEPAGPMTRSRHVRHVVQVGADEADDGIVGRLCAFAERQPSKPVLFYQSDESLLLCSRHRDRLDAHFRLLLPPPELVESTADKVRFADPATRLGLPVPRTVVLRHGEPVPLEPIGRLSFPALLKPSIRHGWFTSRLQREQAARSQKAVRVHDRSDLERLFPAVEAHPSDLILQEAVAGGEEQILSYHAYVEGDGRTVAEFTGRKIRTYPRTYGTSTHLEVTDDPEVKALGRHVLHRLAFRGVVKLDFKKDARTGEMFLLEVNPRFTLWNHPGALAGADLPKLVYDDLVGAARTRPGPLRPGLRWMTTRTDFLAMREYRAAGEGSMAGWLWQALTAHVHEDLTLGDPLPGCADLGEVLMRRWRRWRSGAADDRRRPA